MSKPQLCGEVAAAGKVKQTSKRVINEIPFLVYENTCTQVDTSNEILIIQFFQLEFYQYRLCKSSVYANAGHIASGFVYAIISP